MSNIILSPEEIAALEKIGVSIERFEKISQANLVYDRLMHSFATNLQGTAHEFPNYYGGSYIDDEGALVVEIVGDLGNAKQDLALRIDDSNVKYREVKWSYNTLLGVLSLIKEAKEQNAYNEYVANIQACGINLQENTVIVYMKEINANNILMFKERISTIEAVQFEKSLGQCKNDVSVMAGSGIWRGSVAYRAKLGSTVGVVTAAHVVGEGQYMRTESDIAFAKSIAAQNSGSVDASFCEIKNDLYEPSNTIAYESGATLSTIVSSATKGDVVFMVGKNTGLSVGWVQDINYADSFPSGYFTGLTLASYTSQDGDSGGLVYHISGSYRATIGVNKGHQTSTDYGIFCKATDVNAALGIVRY